MIGSSPFLKLFQVQYFAAGGNLMCNYAATLKLAHSTASMWERRVGVTVTVTCIIYSSLLIDLVH